MSSLAVDDPFFDQGSSESADDAASEADTTSTQESKADNAKADEAKETDTAKASDTPDTTDSQSEVADEDEVAVDDKRRVPLKALHSEREKRREAQQRAAQLEGELNAYRTGKVTPQQQAEQKQPPNDEEQFYANGPEYVKQQLRAERYALSEEMAREEFGETYDENIKAFQEAVKIDPTLAAKMEASRHPAKFAAKAGKLFAETKGMGDLDAWRKSEREKIRAEEQEKARKEASLATAKTIPRSNVNARGASGTGGAEADEIDEPEDFGNILGSRKRR